MKELKGIDCIFDGNLYDDHGLNCFYEPKYNAMQNFSSLGPHLYYLYFYFYGHYNFLSVDPFEGFVINQPYDLDQIEKYVLNRKLGLDILNLEIENNLIEVVENNLLQDRPVFVPLSKREIFYCEEYKKKDHPHFLFIKGFDSERRLFIIQDGEQNVSLTNSKPLPAIRNKIGDVSSQFYMQYDLLEKGFESYSKAYSYLSNHIQVIKSVEPASIDTHTKALSDIAKIMKGFSENSRSLVESKLEYFQQESDQFRFAYVNSHKLFFKLLIKSISEHVQLNEVKDDLEKLADDCINKWRNTILTIDMQRSKKSASAKEQVEKIFGEVLETEQRWIEVFLKSVDLLEPQPSVSSTNM
ncbi:hypothetical protein [Paenibacillus chitinolyticus]